MREKEVYESALAFIRAYETRKKENTAPLGTSTRNWHKRNPWFGKNNWRTAYALGVHVRLEKLYGKDFVGTPKYWREVDKNMQKRFPRMRPNKNTPNKNKPKKK